MYTFYGTVHGTKTEFVNFSLHTVSFEVRCLFTQVN